jgi:hypothetical protein
VSDPGSTTPQRAAKPWGTCSYCDRDFDLKKDGTLRIHGTLGRTCPGSGLRPAWQPKSQREVAP